VTELEAIEAIYQRWKDGWEVIHGAGANLVPYSFDDENDRPQDRVGALGAWATVVVRHSTREQATQGSPSRDDVIGNVIVQLFGPKNQGVAKLAGLANDVRTVLAKKSISDLELYEGRTNEVTRKDAAWAMRVVVIPFTYTEQS
jgi:hypothetical protein